MVIDPFEVSVCVQYFSLSWINRRYVITKRFSGTAGVSPARAWQAQVSEVGINVPRGADAAYQKSLDRC